jgi:hypothetical protein
MSRRSDHASPSTTQHGQVHPESCILRPLGPHAMLMGEGRSTCTAKWRRGSASAPVRLPAGKPCAVTKNLKVPSCTFVPTITQAHDRPFQMFKAGQDVDIVALCIRSYMRSSAKSSVPFDNTERHGRSFCPRVQVRVGRSGMEIASSPLRLLPRLFFSRLVISFSAWGARGPSLVFIYLVMKPR